MIETRPARYRDALELAPRLRFEDAGEIGATWGLGASEGLCLCLLQSDRAFALVESGAVIGLWGVSGVSAAGLKLGLPWLLAAERLFARRREIVRRSRGWVERLLLDYDALSNLTLASNATHLRWLAWCGFRVLRVHRRHGRAGVPYCEFYKVNPLRHETDDGVRETLLGRPVRDRAEVDPLTLQAAGFAAAGCPAAALPELLDGLQQRHQAGGRVRPAVAALLLEAAAAVSCGARVDPLLREWADNALALAETARLDGLDAAELTFALDTAAPCADAGRRPAAAGAGRTPERGMGGVAVLSRHFIATLTLGGRVGRIQGRRLRMAAMGLTEDAVRQPLGIPLNDLVAAWSRQRPFADCRSAEWQTAAIVTPAAVAAGFRGALAGHLVGRALGEALDRWGCEALAGGPVGNAGSNAGTAAALLADRVSRRLLPAPRAGGVLAGYVDRQHLYWLLRARLLMAAGDGGRTLAADIGGLLAAARAEARLLTASGPRAADDDLTAVIESIAEVFGADVVRDGGDLVPLLGVLAPAFGVATVHGGRLGPALLAWYLQMNGALDDALVQVSDVLGADGAHARPAYRSLLRRLRGPVTGACLERNLARCARGANAAAC